MRNENSSKNEQKVQPVLRRFFGSPRVWIIDAVTGLDVCIYSFPDVETANAWLFDNDYPQQNERRN